MRARTSCCLLLAPVLLFGCGPDPVGRPAAEPASGDELAARRTPATSRAMWHHFWDITDARDAVVAGKPAAARAALKRLADGAFGIDELPPAWLPFADEIQLEAQRGERARTIEDAAGVVAAVAQRCGDCHRDVRAGPAIDVHLREYEAHGRSGLTGVMARHAWASEQLWLGMTAPHHQSWVSGAKALLQTPHVTLNREATAETEAETDAETAPAAPEAPGGARLTVTPSGTDDATTDDAATDPAELQAELDEVRAMGERALAAGRPIEMARAYAALITLCGNCHARR